MGTQVLNSDVITLIAGEDLTGKEGCFVKGGAADQTVVLATDASAEIVGVVYRGGASGSAVAIQTGGVAKCKAGGNVTRFARVTSGAAGVCVDYAAPGAAVTNYSGGQALEAGAIGEMIAVALKPGVNTGT